MFKLPQIYAPEAFEVLPPSISMIPLALNFASFDVGMYIISLTGLLTAYEAALTISITPNVAHNKFNGVAAPVENQLGIKSRVSKLRKHY